MEGGSKKTTDRQKDTSATDQHKIITPPKMNEWHRTPDELSHGRDAGQDSSQRLCSLHAGQGSDFVCLGSKMA